MKYPKIINKLRINNEVSWNLTVQNWTIFISLYRSLYRYRVRVPIYVTSSKPKKLVLGTYSTTLSYISRVYNKNMADEEKYLYAFRRRVYNLHLIQISALFMHVW